MNFESKLELDKHSDEIGLEMYELMSSLFPICRSITGNGVRETLEMIQKHIDLKIFEIPSGTKVFDWQIPKEWNISDAYIINPAGEKIANFKKSNLHVVNYSIPINMKISLSELKKHIHTIPEKPDLIPYVTSYYTENWGFCMSHNEFLKLEEGDYHAVIDSKLDDGYLTYGEFFIPGKTTEEILLTCYVCHPSMCNDNLSGVVLLTFLAKYLQNFSNYFSIRFLFIPETIGAITWISQNEKNLTKIKHGLVATCIGDSGDFTYKKSRQGNSSIDQIVIKILQKSKQNFKIVDFFPWGSDERQFCSPAFDLPIGSLMRSMYGQKNFPEYHTSADNLNFVNSKALAESFSLYLSILFELNTNYSEFQKNRIFSDEFNSEIVSENANSELLEKYQNLFPKCEPHLGSRGIYHEFGGQADSSENRNIEFAIFWILNQSDGKTTINEISEKSGISLNILKRGIDILIKSNLIKKIDNNFHD